MRKLYIQYVYYDQQNGEEFSDAIETVKVTPFVAMYVDEEGAYFYVFDKQIDDADYLDNRDARMVALHVQGIDLTKFDNETLGEMFQGFASHIA